MANKYHRIDDSTFRAHYLIYSRNKYLETILKALFTQNIIPQEYIDTYPISNSSNNSNDDTNNNIEKMKNIKRNIKKKVICDTEKLIVELAIM